MIYADRNGNRTEKTTGQDRFLEYIYGHTLTRMMLKPLLGSRTSRLGGKVLDSRVSRLLIPSFVRKNQIDLSIYEKKHYSSYNDFFTRKILAEERPIDGRKEVLISPCDGKVTVCPIQRVHAVVHENVGEVTAQFLRQFVVTLASDFLHDGIAPLSGHVGEIVLYFFRRENPFIAHLDALPIPIKLASRT